MPAAAIRTEHLRKTFGGKTAVEDLTLEVEPSEVFGFLGPNGAGKSTSVKMLLGLVRPDSGKAWVLDRPAGDVQTRSRLGFLPEHFHFQEWLNADELLRAHGALLGMARAAVRTQAEKLLDLVGLRDHRKKRIGEYSKGMKQRIGLAQALLNHPDLIFLDEPTSGLDPAGRLLVRDIIREQKTRGAAVFLNSHLLGEVEATCDRVAFIRSGRVLEVHHLEDLASAEITVTVRARNLSAASIESLAEWADIVERNGSLLRLSVSDEELLPRVLERLVQSGAEVFEFSPRRPSLEEIFIRIVGPEGGL